ncbi:MAG: hypothetical protein ACXWT0_01900 [Methylobacter sp.]
MNQLRQTTVKQEMNMLLAYEPETETPIFDELEFIQLINTFDEI